MTATEFLSMDTPTIIVNLLISLIITAFAYLFVPAILVISKKKFQASTINKIAIINAIAVVILFSAIKGEAATGGFILWSWVAYLLLKKKCLLKPKSFTAPAQGSVYQTPHKSGIYGSDIALQKEEQQETAQEAPQQAKRVKYCTHCGAEIDLEAVVCVSCGCVAGDINPVTAPEQKKPKRKIGRIACVVAGILVLCISVAANIYQAASYAENTAKLQSDIDALTTRNTALKDYTTELQRDLREYEALAEFCDEFVVFVEDDGTSLYHKFECSKFKGSSFWVFNIAAAEVEGYDPCPSCYK